MLITRVITSFLFIIPTTLVLSAKEKCNSAMPSIDISTGKKASGGIYFNRNFYHRNEYFIENTTDIPKGCVCMKETCLRKCCPAGQSISILDKIPTCTADDNVFSIEVWGTYAPLYNISDFSQLNSHSILYPISKYLNKSDCPSKSSRYKASMVAISFHLRTDGRLYTQHDDFPSKLTGPSGYCIDNFVSVSETGERTSSIDALLCFDEDLEVHENYWGAVGMAISCVFILLTLLVYGCLPELKNMHGRVLMVFLVCLMGLFASFCVLKLLLYTGSATKHTCYGLTFFIYFLIMSTFFWMNVMCFDIWFTFSGKGGFSRKKLTVLGNLMIYAVYAFGMPIVLTAIFIALQVLDLPKDIPIYLPGLETSGCFLEGIRKMIYVYAPISILFVANIVFFVLTMVKIWNIKRQTAVLKSKESSTNRQQRKDQQRFVLYIKIFTVMGISWIFEVLSDIFPDADYLWWITDMYNALYGVVIFLIFVCKKKIFMLVKKKYRGETLSRTQTSSRTTSSSVRSDPPLILHQEHQL